MILELIPLHLQSKHIIVCLFRHMISNIRRPYFGYLTNSLPFQKSSDAELEVSLFLAWVKKLLEKTVQSALIWDAMVLLWRHCNVTWMKGDIPAYQDYCINTVCFAICGHFYCEWLSVTYLCLKCNSQLISIRDRIRTRRSNKRKLPDEPHA